MKYDFLIVGAGITGITISRNLAEAGKKVLIAEKRNHVGGNCYDEYDEHGILIHKYGPHIFHTNYKEVRDFLSRFTEWMPYQHKVKAYVDGNLITVPININTINSFYNKKLSPEDMKAFLDSIRVKIDKPSNSKEEVISRVGELLFEKLFKHYTLKQWGIPAEKLSPAITQRIPVRFSKDDRYFDDRYQGIPLHGYTNMFLKMLDHKNIHISLQIDFKELPPVIKFGKLIYTGPIDEFYGYVYGKLPYRSGRLIFKTFNMESYQDLAVINYPNDYDFTRITEYKKLTGQRSDRTTISIEYPTSEGEPFYPVPTEESRLLYEKYLKRIKREKNDFFAGRLGSYRYLNMDVACLEGIRLAKELLNGR